MACVVAMLVIAYELGIVTDLADPRSFAHAVLEMGVWGYLAFVLAYAALQPFGMPGTVFVVAAALIWPWPIAFALSTVGTMAASVVGFSFARFVGRDWVSARIPERLRKYDDALERSAFRTVLILRLVFWVPQMLHAFLGVSKVRFWTHFWGSLFGYLPSLLVVSYMGTTLFDDAGRMRMGAWGIYGGLLVGSVALGAVIRRLGRPQAW